jgi:hypothetical protein
VDLWGGGFRVLRSDFRVDIASVPQPAREHQRPIVAAEMAGTRVSSGCACDGCAALRAEAGDHAVLYARKLPIRGWAGTLSDAEKSFLRHHSPEWYRLTLARRPGLASKPREQTHGAAKDVCEDVEDAA